jgi:LysM repeat protein
VPTATTPPAATATPAASATPRVVRYTAQPGDTLFAVALAYGVTVDQLMAVNGLTNRNLLYAGQVLVIPGPGVEVPPSPTPAATDTPAATPTPAATATPAPTATPLPPDGTLVTYVVQPGDGLFAIARRFNTTTDAIAARNRLDNVNYIMSGEALTIMIGDKTSRPTPAPATATPVPANTPVPPGADPGVKWIDVDISSQMLRAYEGTTEVFNSAVSTGVASHPTVLGTFHIYSKLLADDMRGGVGADAYYLPDVPYTMYFYTGGYALHGTYWHHNFGHPMSHGCVNLPTPAAKWLFNWAPIGTTVKIHQ